MTDLLDDPRMEDALSAALKGRAADARLPAPSFADVERRAVRHRRRRSAGRTTVGLATALLLVSGVAATVDLRSRAQEQVTVATDPPAAGSADARWAVFASRPPTRADRPISTVNGPLPHVAGQEDQEITPYLLFTSGDSRAILYAATGDRWTSTNAWFLGGDDFDAKGVMTVIDGTAFDATRFSVVPAVTLSRTPPPNDDQSPDQLLTAPDSHPLGAQPEHLGRFDWVIPPPSCDLTTTRCPITAFGGDDQRLIIVNLSALPGYDLRAHLATVELRPADEVPVADLADPADPSLAPWSPMTPPFVTIRTEGP